MKKMDREIVLLSCIVLMFALFVRLIFLEAPLQSDDTIYFEAASDYSVNSIVAAKNQIPFRVGILGPMKLAQSIFGYSTLAYYSFSITFYLLFVGILTLLAFEIGGSKCLLITTLFASTSFLILNRTSNALTDVPNCLALLASYYFFLISKKRMSLYLAISVFCGFYSYLIRVPNLIFFVCLPFLEILRDKSLKKSLFYGLIFVILVVLESLVYYGFSGDFFLRFSNVSGGVNSWSVHMPYISLSSYIFDPIINIGRFYSGKIILFSLLIVSVTSLRKKKWELFALLVGGVVLFLFYSYSVTQFGDEIRRALPLSIRYVLPFTSISILGIGYLVSLAFDKLHASYQNIALMFVVMVFALFQVVESKNNLDSIAFGNDDYFLANRILSKMDIKLSENAVVYSRPKRDFRMFEHFSRFQLENLNLRQRKFEVGDYLLYSKKRIKKDQLYYDLAKDIYMREQFQFLLNEYNPRLESIVSVGDVVFAKVVKDSGVKHELFDLIDKNNSKNWTSDGQNVGECSNGDTFKFEIEERYNHLYIFTSSKNWHSSGSGANMKPGDVIKMDLKYQLRNRMDSLRLCLKQYDENGVIKDLWFDLPNDGGNCRFERFVELEGNYKNMRIYLRIVNREKRNELEFSEFGISKYSN